MNTDDMMTWWRVRRLGGAIAVLPLVVGCANRAAPAPPRPRSTETAPPRTGAQGTRASVADAGAEAPRRAVSLAVSLSSVCAALDDGRVKCWGLTEPPEATFQPTPLAGTRDVAKVAFVAYGVAVVRRDGSAAIERRGQWAELAGAPHVAAIVVASSFVCARLRAGNVACWPFTTAERSAPVPAVDAVVVPGIADAEELVLGDLTGESGYGCALRTDLPPLCFRVDTSATGRVRVTSARPAPALGRGGSVPFRRGSTWPLCLSDDRSALRCFRIVRPVANAAAEAIFDSPLTFRADRSWRDELPDPAETSSLWRECRRTERGTVVCGRDKAIPGLDDVVEVESAYDFACGLRRSGEILCWGLNDYGVLAQPRTLKAAGDYLTRVVGLSDAIDVAVTRSTSCAAKRDGTTVCWGDIPGSDDDTGKPERVVALAEASQLIGGDFVCARGKGGALTGCLGLDVSKAAKVDIGSTRGAASITVGDATACVLPTAPGAVTCRGRNDEGQLGNGSRAPVSGPSLVKRSMGAVQIAGAYGLTCSRTADGWISCWGERWRRDGDWRGLTYLEPTEVFGDGGYTDVLVGSNEICGGRGAASYRCIPRAPSGRIFVTPSAALTKQGTITKVVLGAGHYCALEASGGVYCGAPGSALSRGLVGLLGDGSVTWSKTPKVVRGL